MGESSSASYIRLVHHLIEECILFDMNREECMEALAKHANIQPLITSTVWKELEKENKEFFEAYRKRNKEGSNKKRSSSADEAQARRKIHQALSDDSSSSSSSCSAGSGIDD